MRQKIQIAKLDVERRLITAWASKVTDDAGIPVTDSQGDLIPFDEIEKAAARFIKTGGIGRGGTMHEKVGVADIVGMIALNSEEREALGFGKGASGLVVKMYIHDDVAWARVKSGEFPELSIAGKSKTFRIED